MVSGPGGSVLRTLPSRPPPCRPAAFVVKREDHSCRAEVVRDLLEEALAKKLSGARK